MMVSALRAVAPVSAAQIQQKACALHAIKQRVDALRTRLEGTYKAADLGTGDAGVRFYKFNMETGLVSSMFVNPEWVTAGKISKDKKKIEIDRNAEPQDFVDSLERTMTPFADSDAGSLATSSWSRKPNEYEQKMIAGLHSLSAKFPKLTFKVLTQMEEALYSALSLRNLLGFKNPNNKNLDAVTPENTIQFEAGKGSTQSFAVLQTQSTEKAGAFVDKELKAGKDAVAVKDALKQDYLNDLADVKAIQGKKNVVMQGLLAVCLSNEKIVKSLGLDKNDWVRAQIPVELPAVINAVRANLDTGTPAVVTLALLEAFQEKYGNDFSILNMKEDMKLFNKDGSPVGEEAKICGSHGAAVLYFNNLKAEYDALSQQYDNGVNELAEIM